MKVRNAFTLIGATLLCLQGGSALLAQEGPPAPLPLEPVSFPKFHEAKLSNGAQAIIVENHEQPMVTVNLRIKSGTAFDPAGREGLAGATASLLNKGTTSRNAKEVAEAIDFIGASIGAGAGEDWTSVTATALTEFLEPALEIMADMVINPTFPTDELEIERKRFLTGLKLELSDPGSVAQRQFIQGLYGKHPYGSLPTVASVEGMTRDDMVAFHRSYYRPDNSLFVIAGAVDPDDMVKLLNKHFGKWKSGKVESVAMAAPPTREGRKIRFYHKPGSVQANVLLGHLIEPATDPDWPALDVALRIFGGGSQGWLYRTLREEKGYTYGSYASGAKRISRGYLQASAEVRNEVADSSLHEMFTLLERLRSEHVPEADLTLAKDYITGSFPRQIETPQQVAGQIATTRLRGLPQDYLEKYRTWVAAVDAQEVQRVAQKHLTPEQVLVVVVGDATQIYDKVAPFGSIELYDVEGNAITLADLEIKAAEIALDATTIQPITLIYSLNVQGNPVGEITTAVTRESLDGQDVVRSQTTGGAMGMVLEQNVVFTSETFTGIESYISQKMGAQGVEIDMKLSEGVVSGSVTGMTGETKEVSTEVVEGTLLPGMDDYVIWLADLGANDEFEVPAVNPTTGSAYTLKVKVLGETMVTVAAGEFEAYKLEVSAAEGSATIHARKAAPHIVLKQEPAAQPLVIELKEIR
jgi:predicted Zn-dependent peptidase